MIINWLIVRWYNFWNAIQQCFGVALIWLVFGRFPEVWIRNSIKLRAGGLWTRLVGRDQDDLVAKISMRVYYDAPKTTVARFWPWNTYSNLAGRCIAVSEDEVWRYVQQCTLNGVFRNACAYISIELCTQIYHKSQPILLYRASSLQPQRSSTRRRRLTHNRLFLVSPSFINIP